MAQFRAVIRGQRGEASRLGTKTSGIVTETNGWDRGIRVEASHADGYDCFRVYETGGSNDRIEGRLVHEVYFPEVRQEDAE